MSPNKSPEIEQDPSVLFGKSTAYGAGPAGQSQGAESAGLAALAQAFRNAADGRRGQVRCSGFTEQDTSETEAHRRLLIESLLATGRHLLANGYRFTAVTPATHGRVLARNLAARNAHDIFGWNRPFEQSLLDPDIFDSLASAGLLERQGANWMSRIRFASLGDSIYAHSAYPTTDRDAVFFGPDTYRFVAAMRRTVPRCELLVDLGCGSGAGGLELRNQADHVLLTDINDLALTFAQANASLAGAPEVQVRWSDILDQIPERPDVIIANPPYLSDALGRDYRNGGGPRGTTLSQRIVTEGLNRLRPNGRLLLYTGAPVVGGIDQFLLCILPLLQQGCAEVSYEELDPDVFGEELDGPAYADVDRIAIVLLTITKR